MKILLLYKLEAALKTTKKAHYQSKAKDVRPPHRKPQNFYRDKVKRSPEEMEEYTMFPEGTILQKCEFSLN